MSLVQLINPVGLYDPVPNGYSHVALAHTGGARWVLLSGQGGEHHKRGLAADFATQLRQCVENVRTALAAAGAAPADVARLLVLVVDHDMHKLHQIGEAFERLFADQARKPACTLVPVPRLALDGMLIEIEATALVAAAA